MLASTTLITCTTSEHATKRSDSKKQLDVSSQPLCRDDNWSKLLITVGSHRDRRAFAQLFEHFAPLVKGFCLSKPVANQPPTLADELVQEVMTKVWLKAQTFDPKKSSASTWIFTLARNCRIDLLRRSNRHIAQPLETDDIWHLEEETTPVTVLQKVRDSNLLAEACQTLPQEQQQAINKVFVEGKTHSEVAEELGLPLGTVKSRVRLALKKLQLLVVNRSNEIDQ